MSTAIPRVTIMRHDTMDFLFDDEPEVRGWSIYLSWFGLVLEIMVGKRV